MTIDEAIKRLDEITSYCDFTDEYGDMIDSEPYYEALDMAIKCLQSSEMWNGTTTDKRIFAPKGTFQKVFEDGKAEPCGDCISRQAVLDAIENFASILWEKYYEPFPESTIMEMIQGLPSVTPTRPKGEWIEVGICNCHARLKCSVCDRVIEPTFAFGEYSYEDVIKFYPHCHCGADMRGVSENDTR